MCLFLCFLVFGFGFGPATKSGQALGLILWSDRF